MVDDGDEIGFDVAASESSCMLHVWLYGIGFALTFSALFAKVYRVKVMFASDSADVLKGRTISAQTVLYWVVAAVVAEAVILATWTVDAPLEWTRTCKVEDQYGNCLESSAFCSNPDAWPYLIVLLIVHGSALLYACYLCYAIRNVPTNVAEGGWIAMCIISNFQILVLAVPLLFLVHKFPTIRFVIASLAIFLNDGSVVALVFGPKVWALAHGQTVHIDVGESASPTGW